MSRLFDAYRALCEQAFVPIFAIDAYDPRMLLDACQAVGMRVVEYTLRRDDAPEMIPWIRQHYPEMFLLIGSTIDDPQIVARARRRHPQLLTLDELAAIGVDGFVTMMGYSVETIRRYAPSHLMIPAAMTLREAMEQSVAGAQMTKLLGPDLTLTRLCVSPAAYGFSPVFLTGGMTADRLPEAFAAGAFVAGAGFELILRGLATKPSSQDVVAALRRHMDIARQAQHQRWPDLARAQGKDSQTWLDALPFNHPF
jgi:2-keto-3-deoxy-6-phosphogluconate aldolase